MRALCTGHFREARRSGDSELVVAGGARETGEGHTTGGRIQIFVRNLHGKTTTLHVRPADDVSVLCAQLQRRTGIPAGEQRLVFAGKQLEDGRRLAEYGVAKEATLSLALRLRGGGRAVVLPK